MKNIDKHTIYIEIFRKYYRELVFFAGRVVNGDATAEDIVQDAFVKIFEQNIHFDDAESFKAYLFRMVKNACLDYLKHLKAVERHQVEVAGGVAEEYILASITEAETIAILTEKIEELPAECRKIMLLTLEGHSGVEIAQMLGLADSTVRAQKRRGLELLRNMLPGEMFALFVFICQETGMDNCPDC